MRMRSNLGFLQVARQVGSWDEVVAVNDDALAFHVSRIAQSTRRDLGGSRWKQ